MPIAGLPHASKRHRQIGTAVGINVNDAGSDAFHHAMRTAEV